MVDGDQFRGKHVDADDNDVTVKYFFGTNNRVPDVSRYRIDNTGRLVRHFDIPESRLQTRPQEGCIVLLLESPNVDEYQFGDIDFPIAPANGAAGKGIEKCLHNVLSHIKTELSRRGCHRTVIAGHHVVISNPIQFQTSLRSIHGKTTWGDSHFETLRSSVWRTLWNEGVEDERLGYIRLCFRSRLNTYSPSLVINACTVGVKRLVTCFVRTELPNVPLYEIYHPSGPSWNDRASVDDLSLRPIWLPTV